MPTPRSCRLFPASVVLFLLGADLAAWLTSLSRHNPDAFSDRAMKPAKNEGGCRKGLGNCLALGKRSRDIRCFRTFWPFAKIAARLHLLEANRTVIGPPTICHLFEGPLIMPNLSTPGSPPARAPREKSA
jgi:hypothetical protein